MLKIKNNLLAKYEICKKEGEMDKKKVNTSGAISGGFVSLVGWLFTIGFAHLVGWKIVLGIFVWPLFLGQALR
jgi:hypothetical protein